MSAMRMLDLIDALDDLVHKGSRVPMSSQLRVDRAKTYDLLDVMRASLPDQIRLARLIVEENPDALQRAKEKLRLPAPTKPPEVDVDGP